MTLRLVGECFKPYLGWVRTENGTIWQGRYFHLLKEFHHGLPPLEVVPENFSSGEVERTIMGIFQDKADISPDVWGFTL